MSAMEILSIHPGGVPVAVRCIADEIGLVSILDEMLPWDPQQCNFSPGARLLVLILSVLYDRTALYRIERFLKDQDLEILLGQPALPGDFNDDALARALDKLWEAGGQRVFTTLCTRALGVFGLPWSQLLAVHADTTSISVFGAYEEDEPGAIEIRRGFSKQKRPDLKQFGVGLLCTQDGIPRLATVHNGNLDDKTWNHQVLDTLAKQLSAQELEQLLYVADSALVTYENLRELERLRMRFLSRLPETFAAVATLKQAAWAEDQWEEIGPLTTGKGAAQYRVQDRTCALDGRTYRALVVYSTSLDRRKEQALGRRVERERETITAALSSLQKETFACAEDAQRALERCIQEHGTAFWVPQGQVVREECRKKRSRPGRPRKGEEPMHTTIYRLQVQPMLQQERLTEAKRLASTFVLITNATEPSPRELLLEYKGQQSAVEIPFRALKGLPISPVFLKTPHRVEALAWVILMAYLIFALMQYRVRKTVAARGQPLHSPVRKKDMRPTGRSILDMLLTIRTARVRLPDGSIARYFTASDPNLPDLLELLHVPKQAFITVPYS